MPRKTPASASVRPGGHLDQADGGGAAEQPGVPGKMAEVLVVPVVLQVLGNALGTETCPGVRVPGARRERRSARWKRFSSGSSSHTVDNKLVPEAIVQDPGFARTVHIFNGHCALRAGSCKCCMIRMIMSIRTSVELQCSCR